MQDDIPRTVDLASASLLMERAGKGYAESDVEAILDLFADDVSVVFADFPPMRGKAEFAQFVRARLARQINYRTETVVRVVNGNLIGSSWDATWTDARTGAAMRGRGCEFVTVADGKVTEFIASFNAWEEGKGPVTPIV